MDDYYAFSNTVLVLGVLNAFTFPKCLTFVIFITFAIAQHKYHRSVYEEADANKRKKRYCRPLLDRRMKIYYHEGMEPWSSKKNTLSDWEIHSSFSCSQTVSILYLLHSHTREHSSPIENEPACNKPDGMYSKLKETRGGLGLWTHYPADLDRIILPLVVRTSKAG
ncbi:hypothetical protein DH2020_021499 [Rehmannia glutinosa]|uniref:TOD1/MUCI70 glycosyltransferase-like domain-containing protein n=1 Tax=Rehmannia glutinosa TaxID=99300 RepID=A0ABR0WF22_REHGL